MELTQNQYQGLLRDMPSSLPAGSQYVSVDTNEVYIYNENGDPVGAAGSSPFINESNGLPNTDNSLSAYRTGLLGLGEENPEEMLDVVGTSATGAVKFDYTYDDGAIARFQSGGENILSELGLGALKIQGTLFDYFGSNNQSAWRSYFVIGDIDSVSPASGHLTAGIGVDLTAGGQPSTFSIFPRNNDDGTEFVNRIINTHSVNGYSYFTLSGDGTLEFDGEKLGDIIMNGTRIFGVSEYYTLLKQTLRLPDIADWVEGNAIGHPSATYANVGSITRGLGVDSNGFVMSVNGSYAGTAPATASDPGQVGEIRVDGTHIYRCTATNTWERAPLTFASW